MVETGVNIPVKPEMMVMKGYSNDYYFDVMDSCWHL